VRQCEFSKVGCITKQKQFELSRLCFSVLRGRGLIKHLSITPFVVVLVVVVVLLFFFACFRRKACLKCRQKRSPEGDATVLQYVQVAHAASTSETKST
jgi:hypothetical protein